MFLQLPTLSFKEFLQDLGIGTPETDWGLVLVMSPILIPTLLLFWLGKIGFIPVLVDPDMDTEDGMIKLYFSKIPNKEE
jgi:hypothetical protein